MMTIIRILFGLIVLGVVVAFITAYLEKKGKKFPWGWITWVVLGVLGILAVVLLFRGCSGKKTEDSPNPRRITVPVERPWTFRTLEIPHNGLAVKLYKGFKTWPQGGPVSITTPWSEVITDKPGVDVRFNQKDGIYIFLADPQGSERKVQIFNKWDD